MSSPKKVLSRRQFLQLGLGATPILLVACSNPSVLSPTPDEQAAATATTLPPTTEQVAAAPSATVPSVLPTESAGIPPTATTQPATLAPTPACGDDDDDLTPAQTEGPYFTPNTPERRSFIESDTVGTKMVVTGLVLSTNCQPIAQAMFEFWHANDSGEYDNVGYKLRGHFFANDQGEYRLETIMPGLYPGRTRHFHVKVQAPNQPVLTTQLYFPNEPQNATDGIFSPELLMEVEDTADGKVGRFNFVLDIG